MKNSLEITKQILEDYENYFNGSGAKVYEFSLSIIGYDLDKRLKLCNDPDTYIHILNKLLDIVAKDHIIPVFDDRNLKYDFKEYSIFAINTLLDYNSYDPTMVEIIRLLANSLGINYTCNQIIEELKSL